MLGMALVLNACGDDSHPKSTAQSPTNAAPWQRTEEREACDAFDALRQPFFGDLHVHTRFSADASIYGTKTGPRDAYDFARGGEIAVSDADEQPTRRARLARPIDFAAVTDHAEFYGEVNLCETPGSSAYDLNICKILRQFELPEKQFGTIVQWLYPAGVDNPPPSLPFCNTPGVDCDASAVSVWQEIQAAAEEAYDRTSACTFTSFIGYEHTPSRGGRHLHRNVIFRNAHVTPFAYSQLETASGGVPQGLWTAIEDNCLNKDTGCDALIIPHNPNLSDGLQFFDPADRAEAQRRQDREPLVEIYQSKGGSECRFDRLAGRGVGTADELCTFEQIPAESEVPGQENPSIDVYPRRNLVRATLEDGLQFEQTLGANPFRFGFVGGTDSHNATAGNTDEHGYTGLQGNNDATPQRQIRDFMYGNSGGLSAVWAEENSRDAIFAALRRRETFATSGTRLTVRFFAGGLDGVACGAPDFVSRAYETGTPMGGEIGSDGRSPRFAVLALKDPGAADAPGTDLQRIQIIKGWVDDAGEVHEQTFDVAGDPGNGADVDPDTCTPRGPGAAELCTVWQDPGFNAAERAFYYARVVENPSCRWSTYVCKQAGVDPFAADCSAQAAAVDPAFADCCLTQANDPFLAPTVQERAWSSPIWYRPESLAGLQGGIHFGSGKHSDSIDLTLQMGALPSGADLAHDALSVELTDDDSIVRRDLTADAFSVAADGSATVHFSADHVDLSAAERVDHTVVTRLSIGDFHSDISRRWHFADRDLAPLAE